MLTSPEALLEHIARARLAGYAVDDEEFTPEVRCVAAPAIMPSPRHYYAIGMFGPSSRLAPGRMPMRVAEDPPTAQPKHCGVVSTTSLCFQPYSLQLP